jgi:polyisoprenoid-binding protein YceI
MRLIFLTLAACLFSLHLWTQDESSVKLEVEPNHSTVGFGVEIAGFTRVTGKFKDFKIELDYVDGDITKSRINAFIDAASIDTGIPDRDAHLRSEDFFHVERFPEITFRSESIERKGDHYMARGYFSIHGVDSEIELPFEIRKVDGNTMGFRCRTTINRLDYGIGTSWQHSAIPDFLANEIEVEIDFWTRKAKTE